MRYLSHVDKCLTLKYKYKYKYSGHKYKYKYKYFKMVLEYKYKYQVLHLWSSPLPVVMFLVACLLTGLFKILSMYFLW